MFRPVGSAERWAATSGVENRAGVTLGPVGVNTLKSVPEQHCA